MQGHLVPLLYNFQTNLFTPKLINMIQKQNNKKKKANITGEKTITKNTKIKKNNI